VTGGAYVTLSCTSKMKDGKCGLDRGKAICLDLFRQINYTVAVTPKASLAIAIFLNPAAPKRS
jgi:hypothetical protein